jgi:hypothetical protein
LLVKVLAASKPEAALTQATKSSLHFGVAQESGLGNQQQQLLQSEEFSLEGSPKGCTEFGLGSFRE